jgi:hypothetical protein
LGGNVLGWQCMKVLWLAVGLAAAGVVAGCGLAANPEPPTLWLPAPAKDLAATRVGDEVHLHWTMPKNTTDKVALKGNQRAHFCWAAAGASGAGSGKTAAGLDAKACRAAGDGMFAPGKPAEATVQMPGELKAGAPRAVEFFVELQNHAGKTAGASNTAWVVAGAAPAGVTGLALETRAEGVVVRWTPDAPGAAMTMRLHRDLMKEAGAAPANAPKTDAAMGAAPPEEQTLEVALEKTDPGGAVDRDAPLDHAWKYWAERVVRVEADGHALEIAGAPSAAVTIEAKDVFPPAVPAGLTVVVDGQAKAMALSWAPDTDADLAGYVVYRKDATASGDWERISGKAPVVAPSFSDATVVVGHQYAYAVSAVDRDGNESRKSGEVVEEMVE